MKSLIEFPVANNNESIVVEIEISEDTTSSGPIRAGRTTETIHKAEQTFEEALSKIKPAATAVISTLRDLPNPPTETRVQFGVKLTASAGAVLASAGIDANYTITLTWK
jgi:hypothetical protein